MVEFQFADLHCHPNLKTFGQSFAKSSDVRKRKATVWYRNPPNRLTKVIQKLTGITKFSQSDFQTMIEGNVKIAFVSFYPFEKGFFTHPKLNDKISARLASFITSIGYNRVRCIQKHNDYFADFINEYNFFTKNSRECILKGNTYAFDHVSSFEDIQFNFNKAAFISIIPTIEGAHIFNTGLEGFGKSINEREVLDNILKVKQLKHPPLFMTFAHNFNNDLCGHAPSLEALGKLVDQSENLNAGFSSLGLKVLHALLNDTNGKRILIDVKHMSLCARLSYYKLIKEEYNNSIAIIASHAAVTGTSVSGIIDSTRSSNNFVNDSINFYDEELVTIAESGGLFAIQLDANRLAPKHVIKKSLFNTNAKINLKISTQIIWNQLQHVAEVLDKHGLFAWGTCSIGSDFDGTTNPLNNIWTAADLNAMANELLMIVEVFLSQPNRLTLEKNKNITALTVVHNFTIGNSLTFLKHQLL
ncbi:peptidase M19 [Gelidibacter salicanalis]|uniref:Peptidase M19 n=1 Tax=Gelidibacter salicanalis TaxID=291193 RepID=A0A5C7AKP3_9FLAO|nr:membrane dipeptidase [Gelidibacter salicanalis]TXE09306.1 peptidase M19 [Gelidibacter salicanalis]